MQRITGSFFEFRHHSRVEGKYYNPALLAYTGEKWAEMIRDIRKVSRDSSEMGFIRSTLCFPTRYVNGRSPQFIPFFEALRERIDNA